MLGLIIFLSFIYSLTSINLMVLKGLIDDGVFDHPFWTRSLRSIFVMPPFAILVLCGIYFIKSLKFNYENYKFITTKRKNQ